MYQVKKNDTTVKVKTVLNKEIAMNIVIDNSDPQSPIFIEIENDEGLSINIGNQSTRKDGLRNIRITSSDLIFNKDT